MKNFFLCITGLLISFSGWCKVRVPAIFSDHSVFQQGGGNPIWGWAKPGEEVTVSTSWGTKDSATADKNGRWMVIAYTSKAGTGHEVTIQGDNKIVLQMLRWGKSGYVPVNPIWGGPWGTLLKREKKPM